MGLIQKLFHKKNQETKKPSSHYAPLETFMLVKADRINQRLYEFTKRQKARKQMEAWGSGYTEKDLDEIVKAIGIIISQELTIKGKEEWQWENLMRKTTKKKATKD